MKIETDEKGNIKSVTFGVKFRIITTLIYLAFGMLYHLIVTDTFSWSNPWLYVHVPLWPFFAFLWFAAFALILGLVVFGGAYVLDWIDKKKRLRKQRKTVAPRRFLGSSD